MVTCKICDRKFKADQGLHAHIKKTHDMMIGEYYVRYHPRYNLLNKRPLGFKDKKTYFERDFAFRSQIGEWLEAGVDPDHCKRWMLEQLTKRMATKELKYAPCQVEMTTTFMPDIKYYKKYFGSYEDACAQIGAEPLFKTYKEVKALSKANPRILIDTREQKPLMFENSAIEKLAFGDYTLGGSDYNYTYVDRKSASDFKSTMTQGFDRFCREIERCNEFDSYLYVVVESTPEKIEKSNAFQRWGQSCEYIWHNMRTILHKYPKQVQFIFSGSRNESMRLIPYLLRHGETLWDLDIQAFLDKKADSCGK